MADEPIVTTPDANLGEPTVPSGADSEAQAGELPQEPTIASQSLAPTLEQLTEAVTQKVQQGLQVWLGRRDREMLDNIRQNWRPPAAATPPPDTGDDLATKLLENPQAVIADVVRQMGSTEVKYDQDVARTSAQVMAQNPHFAEDNTLAPEVIEEIKRIYPGQPRNIDPRIAAQLVVSTATANVMTRRATTKANPLAANKPAIGPIGGIQSSPPAKPGPKPIQLDDKMHRLIKGFGFSEDVAQELLRGKG